MIIITIRNWKRIGVTQALINKHSPQRNLSYKSWIFKTVAREEKWTQSLSVKNSRFQSELWKAVNEKQRKYLHYYQNIRLSIELGERWKWPLCVQSYVKQSARRRNSSLHSHVKHFSWNSNLAAESVGGTPGRPQWNFYWLLLSDRLLFVRSGHGKFVLNWRWIFAAYFKDEFSLYRFEDEDKQDFIYQV